jgi:chromosome segregation ATPase
MAENQLATLRETQVQLDEKIIHLSEQLEESQHRTQESNSQLARFEAEVKDIERQIEEHVILLPHKEDMLHSERNQKKDLERLHEEVRSVSHSLKMEGDRER